MYYCVSNVNVAIKSCIAFINHACCLFRVEQDRTRKCQLSLFPFYLLITYGVCKKRKYCNRMIKKKFCLLDECSCFI